MKNRAFPWIAAGVIVLDQVTKWWVQQAMALNAYRPLLPGVLKLTHVHNTGSAFSLFRGAGVWLVFVSIVSLVAILRYWSSLQRRGAAVSPVLVLGLALPFGGAAGNLIDRLRLGYVVDFLELPRWPVFNVADSAITVGAILLVLHFMRQEESSKAGPAPADRKLPGATQDEGLAIPGEG